MNFILIRIKFRKLIYIYIFNTNILGILNFQIKCTKFVHTEISKYYLFLNFFTSIVHTKNYFFRSKMFFIPILFYNIYIA